MQIGVWAKEGLELKGGQSTKALPIHRINQFITGISTEGGNKQAQWPIKSYATLSILKTFSSHFT